VAFDCESGPRHIISRENGILVEKGNLVALTEAISLLISEEGQREQLGRNAGENSKRFSTGVVYELWKEKAFSLL